MYEVEALFKGLRAAALLLCLSGGTVEAQTVTPGERVRATTGEANYRITGTLEEWRRDTLYVISDGGSEGTVARPLALGSLSRLEVSEGHRSNAGKGALIGGGIGLALGGAFSLIAAPRVDTEVPTSDYLLLTGIAAAGGAGIGALIGSFSKSERWREYPLDRLRVGLLPSSDGGYRLTVTWSPE